MALLETPALLILGTQQDYIDRLRLEYDGKKIKTAEGVDVVFYLRSDNSCRHLICGKGGMTMNPFRAQRILWVRLLLEENSCRIVKQAIGNGNIIFICEELCYVLVCDLLPSGDLKFITQYIKTKKDLTAFQDPTKYTNYSLVPTVTPAPSVVAPIQGNP